MCMIIIWRMWGERKNNIVYTRRSGSFRSPDARMTVYVYSNFAFSPAVYSMCCTCMRCALLAKSSSPNKIYTKWQPTRNVDENKSNPDGIGCAASSSKLCAVLRMRTPIYWAGVWLVIFFGSSLASFGILCRVCVCVCYACMRWQAC